MKTKLTSLFFVLALSVILAMNLVSASIAVSSSQDAIYPGSEGEIKINVENNFDYDIDSVSLTLIFGQISTTGSIDLTKPVLFVPIGSSSKSTDDIKEDRDEDFNFMIRASNSIEPGNYNLPYTISYKDDNGDQQTQTGTIGITVSSETSLDYSASQETKIIGQSDKITLKIINKGFGEIKFLSVQVDPQGYTLLSDQKVYIGSIASDDFETASFNVLLTGSSPSLSATITYKDFENNDRTETVNLELVAYTKEKALQLGLIKKSNTALIVGVIILVIVIWFVYRAIRKRRKNNKANSLKEG